MHYSISMHGIVYLHITALFVGLVAGKKELSEFEKLTSKPTRCVYERAYDMYGAHCVGLKLSRIPSLKSGIEILDLTDNKLRELGEDAFSSHTSIRFLYLADNSIYAIDEQTFTPLSSLETLDLSTNVIQTLPQTIFNLQSLRNLYLSGNPLTTLNADLINLPKPIKAPLEQLDISNCRLFSIPNFGSLPQIRFYNISYNHLRSLEAEHFANTCNLHKLDLTEAISLLNLCEIHSPIMWLQERGVHITLADYALLNSDDFFNCKRKDLSHANNVTYQNCKNEYLQEQTVKSSKSKLLTIGGGLAGFLVAFILLLYIMHRRNVIQTKKMANKQTPTKEGDKQTNAALLENGS